MAPLFRVHLVPKEWIAWRAHVWFKWACKGREVSGPGVGQQKGGGGGGKAAGEGMGPEMLCRIRGRVLRRLATDVQMLTGGLI